MTRQVQRRSSRAAALPCAHGDEAPPCMRWRGLAMSHHAPLARLPAPAPCGVTLVPPTWPAGCPATACGVTAVPSLSPAGYPTASCGVTCARSLGRPIARPRRDEPIARLRRVPRGAAGVGTQSESGKRRSPRPARRFRVAPEADPVFSSERFLRPAEHAAQGFFRDYFKILLSSTGHQAFIPRARIISTASCTARSTVPGDNDFRSRSYGRCSGLPAYDVATTSDRTASGRLG